MARLQFPDAASVDRVQATANLPLLSASGAQARLYLDDEGTQLADITDLDGVAIPGALMLLNDLSRIPEFLGPVSGVDRLWVRVDGGAPLPVDAQVSARIASVNSSVDSRLAAEREFGALTYTQQKFGQRLVEILDGDIRDCSLLASTDSVGAENPTNVPPDPHEWVYKLAERAAEAYPLFTVRFIPYDFNGFTWRDPMVLQTGSVHAVTTGTFTSGSLVITGTGFSARWVGRPVTSTYLPAGTVVTSVAGNGEFLNVSQAATSSGPAPMTFGARTLTVWGAGTPSRYVQQQMAHVDSLFTFTQPDLILIGQGHNFGLTEEDKRSTLLAFTETVALACPRAEIVLIAQNPKTTAPDEVLYPMVLREIAQRRGYGFIDMRRVFRLVDPTDVGLLDGDPAHPNDTGHELWADTIWSRMTPRDPWHVPNSQQPSSFTDPTDNLLVNGDFATFAPLVGWSIINAAVTQDTTNYETHGYGVKLVPAAAGASSYLEQEVDAATLRRVKGQWLTASARLFVPSTPDIQAGVVMFVDTNATNTVTQSTPTTDEGADGFRWSSVSYQVRADCTRLRIRLYADSGTDGGGTATFDRAVVAPGVLPRDGRLEVLDARQATARALHVSADSLNLSDGAAVTSWTDLSSYGRHLVQATGARQPTFVTGAQNGLPVVRFDGTDDFLQAVFSLPRPYVAFVVARFRTAYSAEAYVLSGAGNTAGELARVSSTGMNLQSTTAGSTLTTTPESWHVYTAIFGSPSGVLSADAGTPVATTNIGGTSPLGVTVGASGLGNATSPAAIDVGEIVVFYGFMPDAPKAAEIARLRAKWGI